jgi:hypothetical protein
MAGIITPSFNVTVLNAPFRDSIVEAGAVVAQAEIGKGGGIQIIGTSEEVINFGDVVTEGYLYLKNLDDTNYVTYGPEDTGAMVVFGKLKPGEFAWLRVAPTVVMRAQADTADVKLDVRLYED